MEYIQNLYYMVQDYWILTMLIGLMSCFVESFIPALPLIGIVTGNAMFFGFLNGMILSWIGSGLGTILLFLLTKKFKDSIHMERFKNEKINKGKIIGIIGNRGIGKTTFINIFTNCIKNKKILIIDFDLINSNMQKILEENKKIIKNNKNIQENKKEKNIYEINNTQNKNEYSIFNNLKNINKNMDLLSGLNELYYLDKINIKNIFIELDKIKNKYDYIFIDTYSEPLFQENSEILKKCDNIIFLIKLNNIELEKTNVMLNIINKKWKINKNKIKILIYRNKLIDFIFYNKYLKKYIYLNFKILGYIKDYYFINLYLKNKIINKIINFKLKINSLFILKNINKQEEKNG